MRKYKKVLKETLSDILCDICGESCIPKGEMFDVSWAEFATIEANWGYMSKKDEDKTNLEICETCFDKIMEFVKSISEKEKLV